jgi:Uma2 family endonuclease
MRYLNAGVAIVWVVDPERRRIVVWNADRTYQELHASDSLEGGNLLPGFQLPLAQVFR